MSDVEKDAARWQWLRASGALIEYTTVATTRNDFDGFPIETDVCVVYGGYLPKEIMARTLDEAVDIGMTVPRPAMEPPDL